MGSCLSKKGSSPSTSAVITAAAPPSDPTFKAKKEEEVEQKNASVQAQETVKKEIFLIKQRKSHERRPEEKGGNTNTAKEECNSNGSSCHVKDNNGGAVPVTTVRTSSCTKEEVDAILIQCGRLSRSSSGKVPGTSDNNNSRGGLGSSGSRKYSGSKRSYDFDQDNSKKGSTNDADNETEEDEEEEEEKQNQLYQRQSRPSRSHRRTPSREKDVHNKRSSSGDRVSSSGGGEERRRSGSSGGRKTSRSPGRRSENPTVPASNPPGPDKSRPGRLVSVPASISNKEKTNYIPDSASKRVSVKRGGEVGGGLRTSASPRSQSPANTRASNENTQQQQQQVPSLSRNSSKKTERSPYRRNPMSEIDENILKNEQVSMRSAQDGSKATVNKLQKNRREGTTEEGLTKKPSQIQSLKPDERNSGVFTENPQGKEEEQQHIVEVAVTAGATGVADSLKPQTITRSRSSRRSRDFDLNQGLNPDETLLNHTAYASMLLEDIQNFHQQKNMTGFSLPPCVTKACSILEAVADLNSCTSSNLSYAFSDDKISEADRSLKNVTSPNDPFLESEVGVINDLMEPSLHKYVTVRRGVVMGGEMEQQESSGSNNFSLNQHWGASPSSWDPNSADSTERWSSMSNNEDEVVEKEQQQRSSSPLGFLHQKQTFSEPTRKIQMGGRRSKQCGNEATTLLPTATQNGGKRLCGSL